MITGISIAIIWGLVAALLATFICEADRASDPKWFKTFGFVYFILPFMVILALIVWALKAVPSPKTKKAA